MDATIRIEMTGHGQGRVFVNDAEVPGVQRITFEAAAGPGSHVLNRVMLELVADRVLITGPVQLEATVRPPVEPP